MSTGCVSFDIGKAQKNAWIDPDGTSHEAHKSWNISDPFTATGKWLDVNVNVNTVPVGGACYATGSGNSGSYWDYRYNRWCTRGWHIEQHGDDIWEVCDRPNKPQPQPHP